MNIATQGAGHRHRWAFLPFLVAGACLPVLDTFVINMILPTIRTSLGLDAVQGQLVASATTATYAVFLVTGSRLGDLFGRRLLFVLGTAGFALASLACAMAPSAPWLIAGRVLQGVAGALFTPQVLAILPGLFAPGERPGAIRWLGTGFAVAGMLGFLLGGLLIAWHPWGLTWQVLFLVYIPLALAAGAGGLMVPESKAPHAQGIDPLGVGLLVLALGLLIVPLTEGRAAGWPLWSLVVLGLSPVAWAAFVRYEVALAARGGAPLVAAALFQEPAFVRGLVLSFFLYVSYGFLFCLVLYLKSRGSFSALDLGLANLPFAVAFFGVSFVVGPVTARLGDRVLVLGFGLLALGWAVLLGALVWGVRDLGPLLTLGFTVAGLGNGLVLPSLIRVVTANLPPRHAGMASGVLLSVQQMGSSLGVVLLGGIFFSVLGAFGDPAKAFASALAVSVALALGASFLSWGLGRRSATPPVPEVISS